jgi:hypothetical protein
LREKRQYVVKDGALHSTGFRKKYRMVKAEVSRWNHAGEKKSGS